MEVSSAVHLVKSVCPFPMCNSTTRNYTCRAHRNLYEVLSLNSPSVGLDEIRKAYRKMVLKYHPDVSAISDKQECTRRFLELQHAYETLSDPVSRYTYDLQLLTTFRDHSGINIEVLARRCQFPKESWQTQLEGLRRKSRDRMVKKKQYHW